VKLSRSNELKFWLKVLKRRMNFESFKWRRLNYSSPSPQHVKIRILKSNSLRELRWDVRKDDEIYNNGKNAR
jgi:hypothetical protein